jgi:hypothetical protein
MVAANLNPRIKHAIPGRLRVHLPQLTAASVPHFETALRRVAGVRSVRASALTGNVLIHFDPQQIRQDQLLSLLRIASTFLPPDSCRSRLAPRVEESFEPRFSEDLLRPAQSVIPWWEILLGLDRELFPSLRVLATVAGIISLLVSLRDFRDAWRLLLGRAPELLLYLADVLSSALGKGWLFAILETCVRLGARIAPPEEYPTSPCLA